MTASRSRTTPSTPHHFALQQRIGWTMAVAAVLAATANAVFAVSKTGTDGLSSVQANLVGLGLVFAVSAVSILVDRRWVRTMQVAVFLCTGLAAVATNPLQNYVGPLLIVLGAILAMQFGMLGSRYRLKTTIIAAALFLAVIVSVVVRESGFREAAGPLILTAVYLVMVYHALNEEVKAYIKVARGLEEDLHDQSQRAEAELRKLSRAVDQSPWIVLITDRDGRIEYVNRRFVETTGFRPDQALGENPRILASGETPVEVHRDMWATITAGDAWVGEVVNRTATGRTFPARMTVTPVKDAAGMITHFVAFQQDMSEDHRIQEQLRRVQRMEALGMVAGGVAHDFNNIVTALIGYADVARARLEDGDPVIDDLDQIVKAGKRAARLTRQLLDFGGAARPADRLDVNQVVGDISTILNHSVGSEVTLEIDASADLPPVEVDPTRIEQVLLNLVVNARDAIAGAGRITVSTLVATEEVLLGHVPDEHAWGVVIRISDDGIGISEEDQIHVFEPFFTTKGSAAGTGLGLSTVFGIVESAGGTVWLESEVGKGSCFSVFLPAAGTTPKSVPDTREAPAAAAAGTENGSATNGQTRKPERKPAGRILVVEDEPMVRDITVRILTRAGFAVHAATDAFEAAELLSQMADQVDLMVTDVVMPRKDGRELAREIMERYERIKILYMSGYADGWVSTDGERTDFLPKPFTAQAIMEKVHNLLVS